MSSEVPGLRWRVGRLAGLLLLAGCGGAPPIADASRHGHLTDRLMADGLWLSLTLGVVASLWLLAAAFGWLPHQARVASADTRRSRWAVGVLALVAFLIVDGHLFLGDLRVRQALARAREDQQHPPIRVQVNAQRWSFLFRHPGIDGRFNTADDVVTVNALRVPVGRRLELQLGASDVVHGLRIPALRIQTDAIPGRITRLSALPEQEGSWELHCSQHCGVAHYRMRGTLEVVPAERYEAWLRAESERAMHREDPDDPHRNWGWTWRP